MNYSTDGEARWTHDQLDHYLDRYERHYRAAEAFEAEFPNWEEREQEPEDRRYVDESDVADPDVPVFHGRYGSDDHGRWS